MGFESERLRLEVEARHGSMDPRSFRGRAIHCEQRDHVRQFGWSDEEATPVLGARRASCQPDFGVCPLNPHDSEKRFSYNVLKAIRRLTICTRTAGRVVGLERAAPAMEARLQ